MTSYTECDMCQGEGYISYLEPGGAFSETDYAHVAAEAYAACPHCAGEGSVEVCAECLESFRIKGGREVCACDAVSLPRAA